MAWSVLRVVRAVLKADIPPLRMHGTSINRTKDTRNTTVVDMLVGITGLIILMLGTGGIAIGIMVMVPTSIDLSKTSMRHLHIPESPRKYMRIMG